MVLRVIADDAGGSPGIDAAIIQLLRAGVLDGAAAFTNFEPLSSYRHVGRAELGIHLNISSGRCVSDPAAIPSLADGVTGRFRSPMDIQGSDPGALISAYISELRRRVDVRELEHEFSAQLELFVRWLGFEPAFVSVHHDLDVVEEVATAAHRATGMPGRAEQQQSGSLAYYLYRLHSASADVSDVTAYLQKVLAELNPSANGEIIVHPARDSDQLSDWTIYGRERVVEYEALQDEHVVQRLTRVRNRGA